MDWTGGARKRFANCTKSNATLQKQKAHFAKQRAKAQKPVSQYRSHDNHKSRFEPAQPSLGTCLRSGIELGLMQPNANRRSPAAYHSRRPSSSRLAADMTYNHTATHQSQDRIDQTEPIQTSRYKSDWRPSASNRVFKVGQSQTENGRLLAERRYQLLERRDWLKLSVLQPVQIEFPQDRSTEHVGKRRKLTRSSNQRTNPARCHRLNPLFQTCKPSVPLRMIETLPGDEVQVRIGTQAFASQKRHSDRSWSANTSMRPPSTSLGPLSEESMLLGDDEEFLEFQSLKSIATTHRGTASVNQHKVIRHYPPSIYHDQWSNKSSTSRVSSFSDDGSDDNSVPSSRSFRCSTSKRDTGCISPGVGMPSDDQKIMSKQQKMPTHVRPDPIAQCRSSSYSSRSAEDAKSVRTAFQSADTSSDNEAWIPTTVVDSIISAGATGKIRRTSGSGQIKPKSSLLPNFPETPAMLLSTTTNAKHGSPISSRMTFGNSCDQNSCFSKLVNWTPADNSGAPLFHRLNCPRAQSLSKATNDFYSPRLDEDMMWREFVLGRTRSMSTSPVPRTSHLTYRDMNSTSPIRHLSSCPNEANSTRATLGSSQPIPRPVLDNTYVPPSRVEMIVHPYYRSDSSVDVQVVSSRAESRH